MKGHLLLLMCLLAIPSAYAATRYVDVNSPNPSPPYTSWATAAAIIQTAVDVANTGDEIVVTNGIYSTGVALGPSSNSNRVAVIKPMTIRSVNRPQVTIIEGLYPRTNANAGGFVGGIRCAYLSNGVVFSGFTLRRGGAGFGGGGVLANGNAVITNCVLLENQAVYGAGASAYGAGGGILYNCVLTRNWACNEGGGAFSSTLYNCTVISNVADFLPIDPGSYIGLGGGVGSCTLSNCSLIGNVARDNGGGAYYSELNNCAVVGNSGLGGDVRGLYPGTGGLEAGSANNCLIVSNFSAVQSGGARRCNLTNCTVMGNSAATFGGGVGDSTLYNCIVYFNTAPNNPNYAIGTARPGTLNYCCATPEPEPTNGIGNIVMDPLLVHLPTGNLRLSPNSPCINAGNNLYAPFGPDLDGNPRIVGGTVDIGAYEFQSPMSLISYGWLQQYGLPTDGSADFIDSDHDGMNNWQEWVCGTCPTNPLSGLRMVSAQPTSTNTTVTWQSAAGVNYFLERGANLAAPFALVATNVVGQGDLTSYADTNAAGSGPFFYRVGVQAR